MIVSTLFICCLVFVTAFGRYQPTWESLDSRPLPDWFDRAKIGIFIHWGVFSVPGWSHDGESVAWFWWYLQGVKSKEYMKFMKDNYPPRFTYADFAPMFKAEFYNASEWAEIFQASGAKYVVFVTKHHEGFTNWPSKYSWNWNSYDVGPRRDLTGELASAIRNKTDLRFGVYHSMFEFFNPLYLKDKAANFTSQYFVKEKTLPELYELVERYHPEVIWSDGDWEAPDTYWKSKEFLAWLYNDSPVKDTVLVNDRWGKDDVCHHGGYLTCADRYNPGHLLKRKWEDAMTLDRSAWGYKIQANLAEFLTPEELLQTLVPTISCGGNILINVGPTSDGRIVPIFEERLRQLGGWLKVNGEAIYASHPWKYQNDTINPTAWYTSRTLSAQDKAVYVIILEWPTNGNLLLGAPIPGYQTRVTLLGYPDEFSWITRGVQGIEIVLPDIPWYRMPCQWAWVFKMKYLKNE